MGETKETKSKFFKNKYLKIGLFVVSLVALTVLFVMLAEPDDGGQTNQNQASGPASVAEVAEDITVLRADEKFDEAEAQLVAYLDNDQLSAAQRASASEQLAGLYADTDRPQQAVDLLEKFIADNPPTEGAYSILAGSYLLLENKQAAIKYYNLQLESMDKEDVLYQVESEELKKYIEDLENEQ